MDELKIKNEKIKQIELDMLLVFDQVCRKLNLVYFLAEGTLLGAIRHQGFIPWDDDIDVCMMRADYERFLLVGQQYLPKNIFVQTIDTDKEYSLNFCKLRNSDTTFIETLSQKQNINHGIYIDIFPIDYYPDKSFKAALFELKKKFLTYRIADAFYYEDGLHYSKAGKLLHSISRMLFPSIRTALIKRDQLFKSIRDSSLVCNLGSAWGKKEIMPCKVYSDSMDVKFEGYTLKAPLEADQYLRNLYGDYMTLPPVEKRIGHHDAIVIDTERPYFEYRDKYGHNSLD